MCGWLARLGQPPCMRPCPRRATGSSLGGPQEKLVREKRLSRRACRAWILLLLMTLMPCTNAPAKAGRGEAVLATDCIPPHGVPPTGRHLSGRIPGAWNRALTAQRLRGVTNRAAWDQWHPWGVQPWPSSIAPPPGIYRTRAGLYYFTEVVQVPHEHTHRRRDI